jgi:hypothetical protein
VPSNGLEKVWLGEKPARTRLDVVPGSGITVSAMNCRSSCADQTNDQPEKDAMLPKKGQRVSSIDEPRGRLSRVGFNLSNGLRRWAVLVMPIGHRRGRTIGLL